MQDDRQKQNWNDRHEQGWIRERVAAREQRCTVSGGSPARFKSLRSLALIQAGQVERGSAFGN
jgi:hypothetical protein